MDLGRDQTRPPRGRKRGQGSLGGGPARSRAEETSGDGNAHARAPDPPKPHPRSPRPLATSAPRPAGPRTRGWPTRRARSAATKGTLGGAPRTRRDERISNGWLNPVPRKSFRQARRAKTRTKAPRGIAAGVIRRYPAPPPSPPNRAQGSIARRERSSSRRATSASHNAGEARPPRPRSGPPEAAISRSAPRPCVAREALRGRASPGARAPPGRLPQDPAASEGPRFPAARPSSFAGRAYRAWGTSLGEGAHRPRT